MTQRSDWRAITRRAAWVLAAAMLLLGAPLPAGPALAQGAGSTVRLLVDYGDGTITMVTNVPWSKGNTVLDALNAAKARQHGITFSYSGSGTSAFLTKIDDEANEGGTGTRKNWQYWVNTTYGDRSFAVFELQALDVIFCRYTTEQGNNR